MAAVTAMTALAQEPTGQGEPKRLELGETLVTGALWAPSSLSPTAAAVVIDATAIAASGAETLADILATIPGVEVRDNGYAGSVRTASVRGGAGGHVVVVVDGARLNDARTGSVDLSAIPLAGVERIEVLRSGASALYGPDAVAGVVYVTTRRTGRDTLSVGVSTTAYPLAAASGLDALLASQAFRAGGIASLGSATLSASGGVERAAGSLPVATDGSSGSVRGNTALLSAYGDLGVVAPLLGGVGKASAFGRYADKGVPGSVSYPSLVAAQSEYQARGLVSWSSDALLDGAASVYADLNGSWSRLRYEDSDYGTDDTHDSLGAEANLRTEALLGPVVGRAGLALGVDGAASTAIGDRNRLSAGAYAAPELALGDFTVAPSVRYDLYSDFLAGLSYGIGAAWRSGSFVVKANGQSAYKAPTFNDLYWPADSWTAGNPELGPERSWSAELGAEYAAPGFSVGAYPYVRYVDDMIAWVDADGWMGPEPSKPVNIDTALYLGADLSASGELGPAFGSLSYGYALAKDLSDGSAFATAGRLALVPLHTVKAELGARLGALKASFDASYRIGRLDSSGDAMPDVFLLGVSAEYEAAEGAFVGLSCDNLLDAAYIENPGYPMPGLSVTLSARLVR